MKRVVTIFVTIMASVVIASAASSSAAGSGSAAIGHIGYEYQLGQIWRNRNWNRNNNNRGERVWYETRMDRRGNKVYRDTYRITERNGQRHEKRVSHVRVR